MEQRPDGSLIRAFLHTVILCEVNESMQNKLLIKKKRLLQRISRVKYRDIIQYVKKVYLADYQLKVLMARKFSNMFFALLPLALHENGSNLVYQFQKIFNDRDKPFIISDRALILLKEQIKSGKYKKILLADDIIIHGRTLDKMYRLIQSWFEEGGIENYEIKVFAYAESADGLLKNMKFAEHREVAHICSTDRWRAVSNEIVDIFYLSGICYTSYVPNLRIEKQSEAGRILEQKFKDPESGFISQTCRDMQENFVDAYVYVDVQPPKFALNCNIRVYEYKELENYVIVPMVMMKPMEKQTLINCLHQAETVISPEFVDLLKQYTDDDITYRTFVYVISAVWGWRFVRYVLNMPVYDIDYDVEEEKVNFSHEVLNRTMEYGGSVHEADTVWDAVNASFKEIEDIEELAKGETDFEELIKLFKDNKIQFEDNDLYDSRQNVKMLLGKYLYLNGLLDEERCQNSKNLTEKSAEQNFESSRRLIGFPVYQFVNEMGGVTRELISAILYAIDFGKGSIVSRKLQKNGNVYFMSVIHAGEQNYKYYENEYFPFLYGLYHLEYTAEVTGRLGMLHQWKEEFMKVYTEYWIEKKHFCLKDDLRRLEDMKIEKDYGKVILEAAWERFSQPDTVYAIDVAKKITG